ncbi:MAG: hypothetical protein IT580_09040, partial [Verrucomicrobiales bacterium]|nr:hypothetical protein [Verrucomicrobiales bacterium]
MHAALPTQSLPSPGAATARSHPRPATPPVPRPERRGDAHRNILDPARWSAWICVALSLLFAPPSHAAEAPEVLILKEYRAFQLPGIPVLDWGSKPFSLDLHVAPAAAAPLVQASLTRPGAVSQPLTPANGDDGWVWVSEWPSAADLDRAFPSGSPAS